MLVEAGDVKEGIAHLRRAVALDPNLTAAWHNLGVAAERQGWLDIAADADARVVAAKPDLAGEWVRFGYVLIALGRFDEAEHAFRRASALQPRSSETLVALASSYYADSHFDEALDTLARASAVNPQSAAAYVNTAAIQVERRRFIEAEAAIRAALRIEPDAARYHLILGRVLASSPIPEKRAEGQREIEAVAFDGNRAPGKATLDRAGTAEAFQLLGQLARDTGKTDQAIAHWRHAIALDPAQSQALLALGQALVRAGGNEACEGQELLRRYERLQGLRDRERQAGQQAEEHPDNGAARLRFGTVLLEQGNIPRAVWELREAVRLRPTDVAARHVLAEALHRQGRDDEAGTTLRAANPRGGHPDSPDRSEWSPRGFAPARGQPTPLPITLA
jgi:tetratricopeptide (TPR) repeat protein